ncbi:hypothetical protein ACH5RR_015664 [Cinchona calisaya]|uniref:Uncharacterized protein n=1 Tax=Cinchona calisaya TaxID=153742 RepID=A0ABD2ZTR4_9GENT
MPSKEDTPTPLAQVEASTQETSTSLSLDSNSPQEQVPPRVEVFNSSCMIYTPSWEVYEESSLEEVSRLLVEALALSKSRKERFGKSLSSTCVADADAMFKHIAQIGDLYYHLNKAQEYHISQILALEAKLKKSKEAKEKNFQAMCVASKHNQENLQEITKLKKENQEFQTSHKNEVNEIQASRKSEVKKLCVLHKEELNPWKS